MTTRTLSLSLLLTAAMLPAQERRIVPQRPIVPLRPIVQEPEPIASPGLPEDLTPLRDHVGTEGRSAEPDVGSAELSAQPQAAPEGDLSGSQDVAPHLMVGANPYRLAFVGGDYVPAAGERVDPLLLHDASIRGPGGTTYGFVMFEGRITTAKRDRVEALGVRLHDHHTFQSMSAEIPVDRILEIASLPGVRWVGRARAEQKVEPALMRAVLANTDPLARVKLLIKVHASDMSPQAARVRITAEGESRSEQFALLQDETTIPNGPFQRALEVEGATVRGYHDDLRLFIAEAPLARVAALVEHDFVHYVELDAEIEAAHDRSTRQINIDYVRGIASADGSDTVVGMMDSGMDVGHVDTQVKWYCGWGYDGQSVYTDSSGHGTHVMGTIMSPGNGDDRFRGCAPAVGTAPDRRIYVAGIFGGPSNNSSSSNAINAFARFAQPFTDSNGRTTPIPSVTNHSWGVGTSNMPNGGWTGTDSLSIALDYRVFYNRQTHVVAAHNQGGSGYGNQNSNNVLRPAVAKLALTVANALSTEEDGSLPGRPHFSSNKGPTGDGRLCPQIMAPGRSITSVRAGTTSSYTTFNGTSMATPHVVGTIAGLHDHSSWMKTSPAATRAVVAATSNPYLGTRSWSTSSDSYYNRQGFGMVDAYKAHYQRDQADGWMAGRYYGTLTSGSSGFSFDLDIPVDATKTNFVLAFDEKPASQGAVRACIHDCDLYIDVEPFTAGFNTGEYSSTRAWDTWDWYQNIASMPNLRGKRVRVKVYPRVRPSGSDRVHFGVAYMIPRGDYTPGGTISTSASETYVAPGETIELTAQVEVPEFLQSNVFVDLLDLDGFTPQGLQFRDRENLLRTFVGGGTPDDFTMGVLGSWFSSAHRRLVWELEAPQSSGWKTIRTRMRADNRSGSAISNRSICVDGSAPSQIQGLVSTTHQPNVWSNQTTVGLRWQQASDNGCSGIDGLASRWSIGGTSVPTTINLAAAATQTSAQLGSNADGQFFTLRPYDRAGNATLHVFVGPLLIDAVDPQASGLSLDGGALYTHDLVVDAAFSASDAHSGVTEMRWSMDGASWSAWLPYATTFQANISQHGGNTAEGSKTVRVMVRDAAGNESAATTDRISYLRCPELGRILGAVTLDNVTDASFLIAGSDLSDVVSATFGSHALSSDPGDWERGWFQPVGDGQIRIHPPAGLRPGSYAIQVANRVCGSNRLSVGIQCNATPALGMTDAPSTTAGPIRAYVAVGQTSPQTLVGLTLSPSLVPSTVSGVIDLAIGNAFQELIILPDTRSADPATCTAVFELPLAASGTTLHFQAFLVDPTAPNPLPAATTNVETVGF